MLQYYLIKNEINNGSDNYIAVSSNLKTFTIEDVFDEIVHPGSSISKAEALATFESLTEGIMKLVRQGNSVVTPLVNIRSDIKGVFETDEDTYDSSKQQVVVNMSPGLRLRSVENEIEVTKVTQQKREPMLLHYYDNTSDTSDESITPEKGARITGNMLKFDEEDTDQGIFFVNVDDGTETRLDNRLLRNKPSELIFNNPTLPAGNYELEVRTGLLNGSSIRTGRLSASLTVA
ncbi:DNA-binding domain-containing protein [Fodinibius sp. N2]|uniref:DNA-binding domain-containing protein n=1 Tax=Fodinibius alkaliphilus TaxID=3140241 RepID=UPI00315A60AB